MPCSSSRDTSGVALLSAATARGLDVDVATAAAVALPVRLRTGMRRWTAASPPGLARDPLARLDPPGCANASLGRLVEQYGLPLPDDEDDRQVRGAARTLSGAS